MWDGHGQSRLQAAEELRLPCYALLRRDIELRHDAHDVGAGPERGVLGATAHRDEFPRRPVESIRDPPRAFDG
jgi:hypothetical protein